MKKCEDLTIRELQEIANAAKTELGDDIRILIGQRGWVWVGYYSQEESRVTLRQAQCVRYWGTTRGLGELVNGPTDKTRLDPAGTVECHELVVVATLRCNAAKWSDVL